MVKELNENSKKLTYNNVMKDTQSHTKTFKQLNNHNLTEKIA